MSTTLSTTEHLSCLTVNSAPSMSEKFEAVWLSDLRFANFKRDKKPDAHETEQVPYHNIGATTWQEHRAHPCDHHPQAKGNVYDRLSADKPGEELTPEATIWKLYVAEAKEFDDEMVEVGHRNIDVMLVFAALFSAILTTFLQTSMNLMQGSPESTHTMLLTRIAQRLETPNAPFQPVEIPVFTPTISARWINGLWFASLGLSLAAALLAMLAKEWLSAFVASRPRPPHAFAIERQARLDALSSWGALQMIDHLSLLLHFALLLFSLGLVIFLYSTVDLSIATIISAITGATVLFYLITTALGAIFEVCPFGTQLSHYTRRVLRFVADHLKLAARFRRYLKIRRPQPYDHTTPGDLRALKWLANNARDPRIGDSAYHALAGLRLFPHPDSLSPTKGEPSIEKTKVPCQPLVGQKTPLENEPDEKTDTSDTTSAGRNDIMAKSKPADKIITNMFVDICHRIHHACAPNSHELTISFGTTVARYSSTLPQLVHHYYLHKDQDRLAKLVKARVDKIGAKFHDVRQWFDAPTHAIAMLDRILKDGCPPFTADSYAWITAAEFRLSATISTIISDPLVIGNAGTVSSAKDSGSHVALETRSESTKVTLFGLRARYSRSLARASILIQYNVDDKATMSTLTLIHLLESIQDAADSSALNPPTSISTHHPQDSEHPSVLPNFYTHLPGTSQTCALPYGVIGEPRGILGGILRVFGVSGARYSVEVERAAGYALNSIAPLLIRQTLKLPFLPKPVQCQNLNQSSHSVAPPDQQPAPHSSPIEPIPPFLDQWPSDQRPLDADPVTEWVLQQLLHLAAIAKFYHDKPGIDQLLVLSLQAFICRSKDCSPQSMPFSVAQKNIFIVKYLVESIDSDAHSVHEKHKIDEYLLRLLAFKGEDKSVFSISGMNLADLFQIIQSASSSPASIETILADVSERAFDDLPHFTDHGFFDLVQIAGRREYAPAVARCMFDLMSNLPTPEPPSKQDKMLISATKDVENFLKAVAIALEHPPSRGHKAPDHVLFLNRVFAILQTVEADQKKRQIIAEHLPRAKLDELSHTYAGNDDLKKSISDVLDRFKPTCGTTKERTGDLVK